ncbi:MAG: Uma2 family endonuclease [Gemmataceae bacterium]|nr:Uma2 family endonuclease [Gemmataceae bacterium]
MSAVPKRKLTVEEYLAIEEKAEFKSEFYDGEMFPVYRDAPQGMAGVSRRHNYAKDNLILELGMRFKGGPCRTLSSDQRVRVNRTGLYVYPDIVVLCGEPEFDGDTLLNPQVIVEVLSDSTDLYDRTTKFRHYQQIPALKEYILVSQDQPVIERFVRQDDGSWKLQVFEGIDDTFSLDSIPVSIPLADVYRGVTFQPLPLQPKIKLVADE